MGALRTYEMGTILKFLKWFLIAYQMKALDVDDPNMSNKSFSGELEP
jgi:hypothetical protein